jgi:hypothetical protein
VGVKRSESMCEWNNGGIEVDLPDDIYPERKRRTVCIDECIVPQIKALWEAKIQTLGCCCGHGKGPCEVILTGHFDPRDVSRAYEVLEREDPGRRWHIKQWLLVDVGQKPAAD